MADQNMAETLVTVECDYCWGDGAIERCTECSETVDNCDCETMEHHEMIDCDNPECNAGYVEIESDDA